MPACLPCSSAGRKSTPMVVIRDLTVRTVFDDSGNAGRDIGIGPLSSMCRGSARGRLPFRVGRQAVLQGIKVPNTTLMQPPGHVPFGESNRTWSEKKLIRLPPELCGSSLPLACQTVVGILFSRIPCSRRGKKVPLARCAESDVGPRADPCTPLKLEERGERGWTDSPW